MFCFHALRVTVYASIQAPCDSISSYWSWSRILYSTSTCGVAALGGVHIGCRWGSEQVGVVIQMPKMGVEPSQPHLEYLNKSSVTVTVVPLNFEMDSVLISDSVTVSKFLSSPYSQKSCTSPWTFFLKAGRFDLLCEEVLAVSSAGKSIPRKQVRESC